MKTVHENSIRELDVMLLLLKQTQRKKFQIGIIRMVLLPIPLRAIFFCCKC